MSIRKTKRRTMGMMLSPAGRFVRGLENVWRGSKVVFEGKKC